jgi:small subunit ribosomal protein S6
MDLRLYEGMFLVDNSEARKNYDGVSENIARIITKYGGEVKRSERWAERRLAYPVRRRDRGTYILVYFTASPESIMEIRRDCSIDEFILRNMILRANAMPEEEPKDEAPAKSAQKADIVEKAEPAVQEAPEQPEEEAVTSPAAETPAVEEESAKPEPAAETPAVEEESAKPEPAAETPAVEEESAPDATTE